MALSYVAVDFETTGLDWNKLAPVEMGWAWREDGELRFANLFLKPVGHYTIDPEAMAINQINPATLETLGIPMPHADLILAAHPFLDLGAHIPVGFNVGSFDMRIMEMFLPNTRRCFHTHRSFDLNSAIFLLAGHSSDRYTEIKEEAKQAAAEVLGSYNVERWGPHTAAYDAAESILIREYLDAGLKAE